MKFQLGKLEENMTTRYSHIHMAGSHKSARSPLQLKRAVSSGLRLRVSGLAETYIYCSSVSSSNKELLSNIQHKH
ncbi:hypothetical protein MHYP_G00066470 [Metynnis hypsauchen]